MQSQKKDSTKDVAVQIKWPKDSTNKLKTSNVIGLKSAMNKITRGVIDDNCPAGINCIGNTMTDAVDKVLAILATRSGKDDSIDYKNVTESDIKQQKLKLNLDDNTVNLEDEVDNKNDTADDQLNENKNNKIKLKLNDTVLNLRYKQDNEDGSDDNGIDDISIINIINMNKFKVILNNGNFTQSGSNKSSDENQYDTVTKKYNNNDVVENLISNEYCDCVAANETDDKIEEYNEDGSTNSGDEYIVIGGKKMVPIYGD